MPIVQQRRGTAAELALANEKPAAGQIYFELDTNKVKIGDGARFYNELPYLSDSTSIADLDGLQASLDANAAAATAAQATADSKATVESVAAVDTHVTNLDSAFAQHKSRHSISGTDPLSPADIGAAPDSVVSRVSTNEYDIALAQADITNLIQLSQNYVLDTDSRLIDARTPTSHASSHHTGGSDAITPASIGAQPAGSYATLVNGTVPASQLPSFVDDVIEASAAASFPATGESDKIYVDTSNNKTYRWGGTSYVEISSSPGSSDAVPEGTTNLYFTDARAQTALAASLAAKADTAGDTFTGDVSIGDGTAQTSLRFATNQNQFDANATDLDYISLYKNGTTVAGLGITTSNFNVGTNGAINYSLYAHGTLVQRSTSTLSRYYVDQFHNGRLYTASGTAALPVISREGDSDTGVYYPAFDQWAVAIGGSEQLHVTSTSLEVNSGAVYSPLYRTNSDGAVGNVAYGRTGDPDTGMFFVGANTLAFSAGGAERLRLDSNGISTNQKIETSNAISLTSGGVTSCAIQFTGDPDTGIVRNSADVMSLVAGGGNRLTVNTGGCILGGSVTVSSGLNVNQLAQSGASTNDVLTWNGTAWAPAAGGGGGSTTLVGLTDTNIASPASSQFLIYNGTAWQNYSPATAAAFLPISSLSGTAISSPAAGEMLRYDGTNWVNAAASISDVTNLQPTLDGKIDSSGDTMTGDLQMTRDVPASETNGTAWGYRVNRPTGAGTLTNAFGFNVPSNFDFATNNYGVRLVNNLSSGKSCFAIYAAGTAYNYLRGNTGIGTQPTTNTLEVSGTTRLNGVTYIVDGNSTAAGLAFDGDPNCGLYRPFTDTIGVLGGDSRLLHSPAQTIITSPRLESNWFANGNMAVWSFNSPAASNTAVQLQLEGFTLTTYSSSSTSTINAIGANGTVLNFPGHTQHNTPTTGEFRFSFNNNIRHTLHNNGATIGGTLEATAISDGTTTETVSNLLARVKSDTTQAGGGTAVNNVVVISQAAYTALATKDANTLYFIT